MGRKGERWYIWWRSYWNPEVRGVLFQTSKFMTALNYFKIMLEYEGLPKKKIEKAVKTLRKNKVAQANNIIFYLVKSNLSPLEFKKKIMKNVMWRV